MRITVIKMLVKVGVLKIDDLSRSCRRMIASPKKLKKEIKKECKRQYRTGIVHPNYPQRAERTSYHRGCWVKYFCKGIEPPMIMYFDTQKEAADWLAKITEEPINRNDIYNAMRWRGGKLGWGSRCIAEITYERP